VAGRPLRWLRRAQPLSRVARAANLEKCCDCKGKGLPNGLITGPLAQDYSFAAVTASTKGLVGLLWQIVPSGLEGNLRTHRECVEPGARISAVGRTDLLGDVAMQVIKHDPDVAVDVPVQTRSVDCLPPTRNAICSP